MKNKDDIKILIIDDSIFLVRRLKEMLNEGGYNNIESVSNGVEAIDKCGQENFDIITCDITMPELNGIPTIKALININKNAKIVVISALEYEEKIEEAIAAGAKEYIVKPIEKDKVLKVIDHFANNLKKKTIIIFPSKFIPFVISK